MRSTSLRHIGSIVVCFAASLLMAGYGSAQSNDEYPIKPIRIVTSPAGGAGDFLARLIASGISIPLREQVIVDNRPSGVIPGQTVSKAPPDGYSLLVTGNSLWIGPLLRDTPYDPVKDFSPINGLFAPSKTPAAIIDRVNRETVRFLNQSDVKRNVSNVKQGEENLCGLGILP